MADAILLRFPDGEPLPLPSSPAARVTQWLVGNLEENVPYELIVQGDGFEVILANVKIAITNEDGWPA